MTTDRKTITSGLTLAATSYFLKRGFSCFVELGVAAFGRFRADVICLNLRGEVVLVEVKSCPQDYRTDHKWPMYRQYANKAYFCMTEQTFEKLEPTERENWRRENFGVLVLDSKTGYLKVAINCRRQPMQKEMKKQLIFRMAWRNGISKRTNRRQRVFL